MPHDARNAACHLHSVAVMRKNKTVRKLAFKSEVLAKLQLDLVRGGITGVTNRTHSDNDPNCPSNQPNK